LAAAQANQLASSTVMVAQLNGQMTSIYLTAFNNWKISVDAGRIPPTPPVEYVVASPAKNGFQWPIPDPAGTPVCAMPSIPADHSQSQAQLQAALKPNTIDVGKQIVRGGGKWFTVGPADTFASGSATPPNTVAEDGTVGTFEKFCAPVGAGRYLQIS